MGNAPGSSMLRKELVRANGKWCTVKASENAGALEIP
jgi:hypothetical protein